MAYSSFKPIIWSEHIQTELDKNAVLLEDCNREFDGDAVKGNKVKILGVARPTVGDYDGSDIGAPEQVDDDYQFLEITYAKFFNIGVDDVDKAQAIEGLMPAILSEAAAELAKERDKAIAEVAYQCDDCERCMSTAIATPDDAKALVDKAFVALWENGVNVGDEMVLNVTPWFYNLFKDKMTAIYTDNMELLKSGIVGMYNGAAVKISTNLYNDNTNDYIILRTKKAIAFAGQINETEAYRPDNLFMDAVKGLDTYGIKVVRPKEMFVMPVCLPDEEEDDEDIDDNIA